MVACWVNSKGFVWERPLRHADIAALSGQAPVGPILGARVEHVGVKDVLIAANPAVFFKWVHST